MRMMFPTLTLMAFSLLILLRANEISYEMRFFEGIMKGDLDAVQNALKHDVDANTVLTSNVASILRIGLEGIPAIHFAMIGGSKAHFLITCALLDAGADPNIFTAKYPPAILYSIGYDDNLMAKSKDKSPSEGIAAILQGIFREEKYLQKFDFVTPINKWNELRGSHHNPPLLSYFVHQEFLKGTLTMITDGKLNINSADNYGITALHLAVWRGASDMVALLLVKKANILLVDRKGRTAFHYACMRGVTSIISTFFDSFFIRVK